MSNKLIYLILVLLLSTYEVVATYNINLTSTRPASINNASTAQFPAIIDQIGESCGNACGIGYVFTYEINASRDANVSNKNNQYPYAFTYNFLNDGTSDSGKYNYFKDAWIIAHENGIPAVSDFGANENGFPTRWMSGYNKYYNAMNNRVESFDSMKITNALSIDTLKQWLTDHGNGSSKGGIAVVTAFVYGVQTSMIKSGSQIGKTIITRFGNDPKSHHALTIVGYNDSVHYDFDGDGKFTNSGDVTTWETGAFLIANTWGTSVWDNGFAYAPYRIFALSQQNGGPISDNFIYMCKVRKPQPVKTALKVSMTSTVRNALALSIGISSDRSSTTPEKVRSFQRQFTYSGGEFPMCGELASSTIETGFDISDLLDSVDISNGYKVFFIVTSKQAGGTIQSVSLIDYTSGTGVEIQSEQKATAITQGKTYVPVINVSKSNNILTSHNASHDELRFTISHSAINIVTHTKNVASVTITDLTGKTLSQSQLTVNTINHIAAPYRSGSYVAIIRNSDGTPCTIRRFYIE